MSVNLTDEQRAGLARFLGFEEVAIVSRRFAPCHPYLIDADGTLEGERQWNDADLMLALLERAAELGYKPRLCFCDPYDMDWNCTVGERVAYFDTAPTAVILAVLQLPEAQPEHRQE